VWARLRPLAAALSPLGAPIPSWSSVTAWTSVSANLTLGLAYAALAVTLAVSVRRIRNLPFAWVYAALGAALFFIGFTHFFDVIAIWRPDPWADTGVRVLAAAAAVATAVLISPLLPKARALADSVRFSTRRGEQLEAAHAELERAHADLTARERLAQRRAWISAEQLRSLVEAMPQLAWIAEPSGITIFRNRRWQEYTGLALDDPHDEGWQAVHDPHTAAQVKDEWRDAVEAKLPYEVEASFRRADGEYRWFLVRALPLLGDDGCVLNWMGTCTDIHEQRLLHDEALRTARMKDEFLTTLSHELRTPLNAILGWSRLLKAGALPSEKQDSALESIERNAQAQARLVDDLLDISRIVAGKMRLDTVLTNPADAVESAVETVRSAATAKGVELNTEVDRSAGLIVADPGRLQQIVWNLVGNAVKFTPHGGAVLVRLTRNGARIELSVSDNGAGIKREFLSHLFERFSQADGSIRRDHGGLGLGLSISKQLVELLGGEISAESRGEGQGALFRVRFPVASEVRAAAPTTSWPTEPRERVAHPALRGLRLLLVEDDADSREVVHAILEDAGINVTCAVSAEEALAVLERTSIEVIVSDVGLPGRDGYEFIRAVRSNPALNRIPAAALTAYAYVEDRKLALAAGFQIHLRKPFEQAELLDVIDNLATIAATLNE